MPDDTPAVPPAAANDDERLRRRASFDADALAYDLARPGYPDQLFDDLLTLSGVPPHGSVLEVGSGTGKASLPLAERGLRLLGVELGANMAAIARERLAAFPHVRIVVADFERYPLPDATFDLAVSASAWHWIDPAIGYPKVAAALKPGGAFALLGNSRERNTTTAADDDEHNRFRLAARELTRGIAPGLSGRAGMRRGEQRDEAAPTRSTAGFWPGAITHAQDYFDLPAVRSYDWDATYSGEAYTRLLDSYSSYRILDAETRERLYTALTTLIDTQFGGAITLRWRSYLAVAKRTG